MLRSAGFRRVEFVTSHAPLGYSEESAIRVVDARGYWLGMGASFMAGIVGVLLLYLRFDEDALFGVGIGLIAIAFLLGRATISVLEQRIETLCREAGLVNPQRLARELVSQLWRRAAGLS